MAENADRVLKKCDIVMKGGVTSGIVYPGAVCRLAKNYRFQSIGGTSAGAIAASLTAAAEYARSQGRDVFSDIGKAPDWLGHKSEFANGSNLFNLFRPQPGVKGLFKFLSSFLIPGWGKRLVIWAKVFWLELLTGFAPGGVLAWLASGGTGWRTTASIVLSIFVGIAGGAITAVLGLIVRISKLPKYRYGLCTGYAPPKKNSPQALVNWLNEKLNALANKPPDQPLTFGDLKQANIDLRMITTCITFGRPYTLPFDSGEFYYSPSEMRLFFPPEVVDWMEKHPKRISDHGEPVQLGDLKPLPGAEELPVVVAARLSLSFPVLFCMAPLYAVDWTRRRRSPSILTVRGNDNQSSETMLPNPVFGPYRISGLYAARAPLGTADSIEIAARSSGNSNTSGAQCKFGYQRDLSTP
jgi:hypothetical protein